MHDDDDIASTLPLRLIVRSPSYCGTLIINVLGSQDRKDRCLCVCECASVCFASIVGNTFLLGFSHQSPLLASPALSLSCSPRASTMGISYFAVLCGAAAVSRFVCYDLPETERGRETESERITNCTQSVSPGAAPRRGNDMARSCSLARCRSAGAFQPRRSSTSCLCVSARPTLVLR